MRQSYAWLRAEDSRPGSSLRAGALAQPGIPPSLALGELRRAGLTFAPLHI